MNVSVLQMALKNLCYEEIAEREKEDCVNRLLFALLYRNGKSGEKMNVHTARVKAPY